MGKSSFFGRVWQDSRRSMPSPSVGPLSATPTLPVFSESARAQADAKSFQAEPTTTGSHRAQSAPHSSVSQTSVRQTDASRANTPQTTLAFESLRFEPVPNGSRINSGVLKPSSPLARPGQLSRFDSIKPDETFKSSKTDSVPPQASEVPWVSPRPGAEPSAPQPVADKTAKAQSQSTNNNASTRQETASVAAVERSGFKANEPGTREPIEATPAASTSSLDQKRGAAPTAQAGSEDHQPSRLHIGEVRIRLIEEPKQASPQRSSLTHTESDSRRLLRSL